MEVEKGDTVKVHYTGKFENGKVFDTSEGKDPLSFETGAGRVIRGFDDAVIGMKKDEEKEVKIPPKDAYGTIQDELQRWAPAKILGEQKPVVGMVLSMKTTDDKVIRARIKSIEDDKILLDMNHPLAGRTLVFSFRILDIEKAK